MSTFFNRSPYGLADESELGRSALNNPQLYNQILKLNLNSFLFRLYFIFLFFPSLFKEIWETRKD